MVEYLQALHNFRHAATIALPIFGGEQALSAGPGPGLSPCLRFLFQWGLPVLREELRVLREGGILVGGWRGSSVCHPM